MVKPSRQNQPGQFFQNPAQSVKPLPDALCLCFGSNLEHVTEKYQSKPFEKTHFKLFWPLLFFPLLLGREVAGTVTLKQIYEIAKIKKQDSSMKNVTMESLCKIIIGSTKSMGIEVVPGRDEDTWHKAYCVRFLQWCSVDCHAIFFFGLSRNHIFWIVMQYLRKDIITSRSFFFRLTCNI